ncbi:MAG: response regulator [Candidatus Riflebacteria bacterium]|nr:response regulator [Candidatus Riflebacteria bacterium]
MYISETTAVNAPVSFRHKILIVEDDRGTSFLLCETLSREGYSIEQAFDGKKALELVSLRKFDLILLDLVIPGIDGIEICRQIRSDKRFNSVPILILTAKNDPLEKMEGFAAGANDYILKPFMLDEVIARVKAQFRIIELRHNLVASESRYRQVVEHSPDGILILSNNEKKEVLFANKRFSEIVENDACGNIAGISATEAAKRCDLFREILAGINDIENSSPPVTREAIVHSQPAPAIFLEVVVLPIINEDSCIETFQVIIRDITNRKRMEKAMTQAEKIHSLGILTAGIAHEINNPLTGISNAVQIMKKCELSKDRQTQMCEHVLSHIERIAKITREMSQFSKPYEAVSEKFSVSEVISNALMLVGFSPASNNIQFQWAPPTTESPILFGNKNQFQQVIFNLLINAVQSIEKIGTVNISLSVEKSFIVISISDTGCGIPENQLKKIFDPFFTTKRDWKGTGLGLAVSCKIVQAFNGTIDVESVEKKGSKFTIKIPSESKEKPHKKANTQ